MCMYEGQKCICVPNMKLLCLILWQGEVCTDANIETNDDTQSMIVQGSLTDKPNEPKILQRLDMRDLEILETIPFEYHGAVY